MWCKLFGRRIWSRLDALRPSIIERGEQKQWVQKANYNSSEEGFSGETGCLPEGL